MRAAWSRAHMAARHAGAQRVLSFEGSNATQHSSWNIVDFAVENLVVPRLTVRVGPGRLKSAFITTFVEPKNAKRFLT